MTEVSEAIGAFEDSVRRAGFLSEHMPDIAKHLRATQAPWFALLEGLNELAQDLYVAGTDRIQGKKVLDPFCIALQMMPRALGSYQGAVILLERGMTVEAGALTRGVLEVAFWIAYVQKVGSLAVEQFVGDEVRATLARLLLIERRGDLDPGERRQLAARIAEARSEKAKRPKSPDIAKIAELGGRGPDYLFYRELSGGAAHASLYSVHGYLTHDDDGSTRGHQIGPDEDGLPRAFWLACHAIMIAIEALRHVIDNDSENERFKALLAEFDRLTAPAPA